MDKKKTVYNWEEVPVVINLPFVAIILKANPEVVRRYVRVAQARLRRLQLHHRGAGLLPLLRGRAKSHDK